MKLAGSLLLLVLFSVGAARADGPVNELDSTLAYVRTQPGYNTVGGFGIGYRGIGYGRDLNDWLEISIRSRFTASANTSQTPGRVTFEATAGPTFNFAFTPASRSFANDFFLSLGAGINYTSINAFSEPGTLYTTDQSYATNPALSLELGKRFEVLPNLSFKPSVSVGLILGTDIVTGSSAATPAISLNPVELSIVF